MAIGISSIVAVKISSAALSLGSISSQAPAFGVSETASTPFTITWGDGSRVASIPATSLDEIITASMPTLALVGSVVTKLNRDPAYSGIVVDAYARVATSPVASTTQMVLVKTLSNGAFLEMDASTVIAVE